MTRPRARPRPPIVLDSETKGIQKRPQYPPIPVGVSILYPGKKPVYYHWGHPTDVPAQRTKNVELVDRWSVVERLKDISRGKDEVLFHNAKFDLDVFETHMEMPPIRWDRIHETMYLIFLEHPHTKNLGLKPSAERLLGMEPEERDLVKDWIMAHKAQIEATEGKFTPKEWGAHISMAPPHLVGPYANGDTQRTLDLFNHLMPIIRDEGMEEAYDRERELMPILLENERHGMRVDLAKLESDIVLYQRNMERTDEWLRKRLKSPGLDFEKDIRVADALEAAGVVTAFHLTKTGRKSVAKKNLTPDMFHDPRVAQALGYRNRLQTCLSTFMLPWQKLAAENGGRIHTNWNQVRTTDHGSKGARTGRMSCSPNFMNIPTEWYEKGDGYVHPKHLKIEELPVIRSYILGDKGQVFGGRDYNQQELRILGHFEDGALMQAYQENPLLDTHTFVQTEVQNILDRAVGRKVIKEINFGTIYGQGAPSLAEKLGEQVDTIQLIKNAQLKALPGLASLNKGIKQSAREGKPIYTWGGRRYFKEPSMVINGRTVDFAYKLLNYLIQGSAADCTKQAIINYHAIKRNGRFLATVHDENNISAPAKAMKAELKLLGEAMADVKFDVAMLSEPYMGPNWGAVQKYKET